MAVTIINPIPDPSVVKEVICKKCGVELQYVPIDVKRRNGRDYSGGADGEEWIDCPACMNKVILRSW